ncbi:MULTISPECIES: FAD assembly factor SdhE [Nitrospirillum]|uniref:FAD assembly factor SdhE n=1 Tax=Nitrospirillum amazonense TaxID=28077 RepID=A0A560GAE5_9PROT|nr:succinate dehydrogenase assembly factor 2 [Nitrospirillum amazonense]MEC4591268.1 succinate dehydrogenase assembly factor 2 [Nitrospirillum amazonense]TWB30744.1 antitoxin CptB [Nitrospirillum amazonense]
MSIITHNPEDDASQNALAVRRKRLIFRSWHRGMKEMDLLMGTFAEKHVPAFTVEQLDRYEHLLDLNDPDVFDWLLGRAPFPDDLDADLMALLQAHRVA